jgi:hypothetical protein
LGGGFGVVVVAAVSLVGDTGEAVVALVVVEPEAVAGLCLLGLPDAFFAGAGATWAAEVAVCVLAGACAEPLELPQPASARAPRAAAGTARDIDRVGGITAAVPRRLA